MRTHNLDEKTVVKVAELSRLKLTPEEVTQYTKQLTSIVESFEKLSRVNTDGVEPLITPTDIESRLRSDELIEKFNVDELMESAPDKAGHLYKVPPVV